MTLLLTLLQRADHSNLVKRYSRLFLYALWSCLCCLHIFIYLLSFLFFFSPRIGPGFCQPFHYSGPHLSRLCRPHSSVSLLVSCSARCCGPGFPFVLSSVFSCPSAFAPLLVPLLKVTGFDIPGLGSNPLALLNPSEVIS